MKILQITVSSGRVIPHPIKRYASMKPMVSVTAEVDLTENWQDQVRALQAEVEQLVLDHGEIISVTEVRRDEMKPADRIKTGVKNDIIESQEKLKKARET